MNSAPALSASEFVAHTDGLSLPSVASVAEMSTDTMRQVVQLYTTAFQSYFLSWLAQTALAAKSALAREVALENLAVEQSENHPDLLYHFAESAMALPTSIGQSWLHAHLHDIQLLFAQSESNLGGVALIALLENYSLRFIPVLDAIGVRLCLAKHARRYTQVHGEADIAHAHRFSLALDAEIAVTDLKKVPDKLLQVRLAVQRLVNRIYSAGEIF